MRRTAEMELHIHVNIPLYVGLYEKNETYHAELLPLLNMLALLHRNLIRRHLNHAHKEDTHQSDIFIVSIDKNHRA